MIRKIIVGIIVITFIFTSFSIGWAKNISLNHFGIRVKGNLYSRVGKTLTGTIVNTTKIQYGEIFSNVRRGDRVEVTYLGNGQVQLRHMASGETTTIDVTVTANE